MSESEKPTPTVPRAEAELRELLERLVSIATQGTLETKRLARIVMAEQRLDARQRMAHVDVLERQERVLKKMASVLDTNRPASLTVVQDVPSEEDWSLVHIKLPGKSKTLPVPNRVLWGMASGVLGGVLGWIVHWLVNLR